MLPFKTLKYGKVYVILQNEPQSYPFLFPPDRHNPTKLHLDEG